MYWCNLILSDLHEMKAWQSGGVHVLPFAVCARLDNVDRLTLFGLFAVTAMLVTYALETRSHWFILAFAGACVLGSIYGFLQGAWPFGVVEAIWAIVAARRWHLSIRKK
jgi:hypothetical protein